MPHSRTRLLASAMAGQFLFGITLALFGTLFGIPAFTKALGLELGQLEGSVDVHITHIKPGEMSAVMDEVGRLQTTHRIHALSAGQKMHLAEI